MLALAARINGQPQALNRDVAACPGRVFAALRNGREWRRLFGPGPDLGAAQRAGAALHFKLGVAAWHEPALVGLAVFEIINPAGPGVGVVLLHREDADAEDFPAAQARVRIFD